MLAKASTLALTEPIFFFRIGSRSQSSDPDGGCREYFLPPFPELIFFGFNFPEPEAIGSRFQIVGSRAVAERAPNTSCDSVEGKN